MGRDRDLGILRTALSSPPCLTIVEGEGGVGKSRLVRELADDPALSGMLVLVGQCEQLHEPFPLGPVLDALQQAAPAIRPEALSAVTGALAPLMPELAHLLPTPPAVAAEPGTARHQVFRAVTELLAHVGPVALVLEDAHWADSGTFDLLTFLAFHQPAGVAVLLTTRSESGPLPIAEAFTRAPAGPAKTLALAPLDTAEVCELARRMLGVDLPARVADELRGKTGGIPFVVEEVLRTLLDRLPDSPDLLHSLEVPMALRDVMLQRLSTLDPVAREIVGVASVLSRRVDVALLSSVAERSTREVVAAVSSAQAAGLLRTRTTAPFSARAGAAGGLREPAGHEPRVTSRSGGDGDLRAARCRSSARLAYHSKRAGNTLEFAATPSRRRMSRSPAATTRSVRFLLEVVESGDVPLATRLRLGAELGRVAIDGLATLRPCPSSPACSRAVRSSRRCAASWSRPGADAAPAGTGPRRLRADPAGAARPARSTGAGSQGARGARRA